MELESVAISLARRAMRFALIADAHEAAAASAATMAIQSLRSNPSGMSGATRAAPAQRRRGPGQRGCGGQHRQPEELRGTPPPPLRRRDPRATAPRRGLSTRQTRDGPARYPLGSSATERRHLPNGRGSPSTAHREPCQTHARPLASSREPGLQRVDEQQFKSQNPPRNLGPSVTHRPYANGTGEADGGRRSLSGEVRSDPPRQNLHDGLGPLDLAAATRAPGRTRGPGRSAAAAGGGRTPGTPGVTSAMFASVPGGAFASTRRSRWTLTCWPGLRRGITRQRSRPTRRSLRSARTNVVWRGM